MTQTVTDGRPGGELADPWRGVRAHFAALSGEDVLMDNAGGSLMPRVVADAMHRYMLENFVPPGGRIPASVRAKEVVDRAHQTARVMVNAGDEGEVVLGGSCSTLSRMIADAIGDAGPTDGRDQIIVATAGHESNVGAWLRLASRGFRVDRWEPAGELDVLPIDTLASLLGNRTRMVVFPQVSNIVGYVTDFREITRRSHAAGARVFVDGVAYAPHRAVDVRAWGADWYVYSAYKVYGPHLGVMYGRRDAFDELDGPGFFYVKKSDVRGKFELGGVARESCAGLVATGDYLGVLAGIPPAASLERRTVELAFARMEVMERLLQDRLIRGIQSLPEWTIVGPTYTDERRVSTVCVRHNRLKPAEVVAAFAAKNIGIRSGHFCSYRLVEALGIDPREGVARISPVHYNTTDEVDRVIDAMRHV